MIFTDNYNVTERYSLLRKEHIGTYSEMPWLYTPLVDERYAPHNLTLAQKVNLSKIFNFGYFWKNRDTIKDEKKLLGLHHSGNAINSFDSKFNLAYTSIKKEAGHFRRETNSEHLESVWQKMHEVIAKTDLGSARLLGMPLNSNAEALGLYFIDKTYDVSSYNNTLLQRLVDYSNRNCAWMLGAMNLYQGTKCSFKTLLEYPKTFYSRFTSIDDRNTATDEKQLRGLKGAGGGLDVNSMNKLKVSRQQIANKHIFGCRQYDLLTDEQSSYILTELWEDINKDFAFDLEYIFEDGELVDIICDVIKYEEFVNIEDDIKPPTGGWAMNRIEFNPNNPLSHNYTKAAVETV